MRRRKFYGTKEVDRHERRKRSFPRKRWCTLNFQKKINQGNFPFTLCGSLVRRTEATGRPIRQWKEKSRLTGKKANVMLKNTFIHIQGIGAITEKRIWASGIRDWDAFSEGVPVPIPASRKRLLSLGIEESRLHFAQRSTAYFAERLPSNQSWRLFPDFRDCTAYLDIETTGLDWDFGSITAIALYDGQAIKTYVQGQDLNDFVEDIEKYKVIVTYNGKCFDVPFIERYFNIRMNHAHIDLRYILQSLGFKGGLKGVERQLGLDRGDLRDIDGYFAVLLWNEYVKSGNPGALETLLAYNVQDTVSLETLMVAAYNMKLKSTPFSGSHQVAPPVSPFSPFKVDLGTVEKMKRNYGGRFYGYGR
jgi:uncharacterized protein YprB with RNaseH-like and TPR domain